MDRPETPLSSPTTTTTTNNTRTTFFSAHVAPISNALSVYVRQTAFLPSMALSILYLNVLTFSGQMTTFVLAIPEPRITSTTVGMLRTVSTAAEISSTFVAPRVMAKIGPVRAGIWFLSWQILCLSSAAGVLWTGIIHRESSPSPALFPIFIVGVILSRFGLWSFDLCAQLIIQESIQPPNRGTFSAVEMSLQNLFELCAFATTLVFPRPDQFRFPALISLAAAYCAATLYAKFVRDRRGHLLHMPSCLKGARDRDRHRYEPLTTGDE
jgi:iron-regulated transporter 1